MAKLAKKSVKTAPKKQTIDDRLDFIEGLLSAITYVIMSADISVKKKPAKKTAKKAAKKAKK